MHEQEKKQEANHMQLVEQHMISKRDPRYAAIDVAAFKSKNLYNAANYQIRQSFIHEGKYLTYNTMDKLMQSHEAYQALPAKVSQQILMVLDRNWTSFREARKAYEEDPPHLPDARSRPSTNTRPKGAISWCTPSRLSASQG